MKVRVITYKADAVESLREPGDFCGTMVSKSQVLLLGSDVARTAIQNALAELESGRVDQVEITRVVEA
ncbi:MAG: hypothetical protein QXL10_01615 [Candidatus Bathyarchaeia archaeon]